MSVWLILLAAGFVTFATRLSFILLLHRIKVPNWFTRSLRLVPPAVLSAIILPGLVSGTHGTDFSFHNPQIIAGGLAILVAWRTKNVILTILAGMAALLILRFFLG